MKRIFFCTTICSLIFAFSSQAFAVAVTASSTALANTREAVRDCSKTQDPNVKYRCEVAAARAAAQAEQAADKKKKDMIATAIAGAGAVGAFMNMRKDNESGESSSTSTSTSSTTSTTTTSNATATSSPAANSTAAPASSARPSTASTPATRPQSRPNQTTSGSAHICVSDVNGEEVTATTISSSCRGSDLMVDLSSKCMCIQDNCFKLQTKNIPTDLEIYQNAHIIPMRRASETQGYRLGAQGLRGFMRINKLEDGGSLSTGLNLPDQAFEFLDQVLAGAESGTDDLNINFCGANSERQTMASAAPPVTVRPPVVRVAANPVSNNRAPSRTAASNVTPVASQISAKMNYAVKVRNQFAPAMDSDSIN